MIVYIDTSVILRVLLNEKNPIEIWGKWKAAYSSRLWKTEALRTIDRLRHMGDINDEEVSELVFKISEINETIHVISLNEETLTRAGESFPTTLGTLDGIHLATAILARRQVNFDNFLTHDKELGLAAKSVGFNVTGI